MAISLNLYGVSSFILLSNRSMTWYLSRNLLNNFEYFLLAWVDICVIIFSIYCICVKDCGNDSNVCLRSGNTNFSTVFYPWRQPDSNLLNSLPKFVFVNIIADVVFIVVTSSTTRYNQKTSAFHFCFAWSKYSTCSAYNPSYSFIYFTDFTCTFFPISKWWSNCIHNTPY